MIFFVGFLLVANGLSFLELSLGNRRLKKLRELPLPSDFSYPKLSLILAAKDEEEKIGPCVKSLLALDYPNLELIVVDDRSNDRTPQVLGLLAKENPRLLVETVHSLPEGWLGKNHALIQGFKHATGDWLLFTDGDILFEPSVLKRAIAYAEKTKIDHLPTMPELLRGSFFYDLTVPGFIFYFLLFMRPWLTLNPRKKNFLGVGAFNLVRRETYVLAGTHEGVKLRPDEDIRLGERIKKTGARQESFLGDHAVRVQWYSTFGELCRGLEKNILAGIDYKVGLMLLSFLTIFSLHIFPFVGLFFFSTPVLWVLAAIVGVQFLGFLDLLLLYHRPLYFAPCFPLSAALYLFVLIRGTWLTVWRRGIEWRGTFYSLKDLREK